MSHVSDMAAYITCSVAVVELTGTGGGGGGGGGGGAIRAPLLQSPCNGEVTVQHMSSVMQLRLYSKGMF